MHFTERVDIIYSYCSIIVFGLIDADHHFVSFVFDAAQDAEMYNARVFPKFVLILNRAVDRLPFGNILRPYPIKK